MTSLFYFVFNLYLKAPQQVNLLRESSHYYVSSELIKLLKVKPFATESLIDG